MEPGNGWLASPGACDEEETLDAPEVFRAIKEAEDEDKDQDEGRDEAPGTFSTAQHTEVTTRRATTRTLIERLKQLTA